MQRPLDANRLLALVEEGVDAGTFYIDFVKEHFEQQNMSEGVDNLILAFGLFKPYLRILSLTWEDYGPDKWRIDFGVGTNGRFCRLQRLTDSVESPIHTSEYHT